ncbi:ABC transporter permease [Fibrella sp. HMF5335]|uniref:ABC transporter permease n=1 Tax=Fibrella rubiginis TaxID=2817060 RepID=A0A939K1S7_9BACT|nr:ABC transporter permease [Fibrella rubiginis]MBO0937462.1 ABC transporter permease [Fibrella rubiginis]
MLRNYFTITLRNLRRNTVYSAINIGGLALGIAAFLLIFEFIASEWTANRFHTHYDTLYRVIISEPTKDPDYSFPGGVGPLLKEQVGGIDQVVRVADYIAAGVLTTTGPKPQVVREQQLLFSDADFFRAFTFPFQSGTNTLDQPQTMALSQTLARKLFGLAEAVGKTITVSNQFGNTLYTVTGVFADMPVTSDLQAQAVLALSTLNAAANRSGNDWADPTKLENSFTNLYLNLNPKTNAAAFERQLTSLGRQLNPVNKTQTVHLQPFRELHLAPSFTYPFQTFGSLVLVVALAGISLLVLLIAWVNYVNLATAQAMTKTREVGIRRLIGGRRSQLMSQFLTETVLFSVVSVGLGLLLAVSLQPVFNGFVQKELSLSIFSQSGFWAGLLGVVLGTAAMAGTYVAYTLSSAQPLAALTARPAQATGGLPLRQMLVVFQFGISVVFIIVTLVMYRQISFMQTGRLGLNLDQLLVLVGPTVATDAQGDKNSAFKQELARLPFVQKVAGSNNVPGAGYNFGTAGITRLNPAPGDDKKNYQMFIADHRFFDTYGIGLVQGRPFTEAEANASWNNAPRVAVNERAARQLGYDPKQPVAGKKLLFYGKSYDIVAVVKDYHHLSMREAIAPVIYLPSVGYAYFTIQLDTRDMSARIATLEKLYKQTFPGNPFEYHFASEVYNSQFQRERQLSRLFVAASLLAIFIACLGIFGLAAFAAQQRTKEIGVRKVLGASVVSIAALLSKDFLRLVVIALIIASPLAWYAMRRWLADFAYRVDIEWWVFALAGALAVGIALLTVSVQSIKAALVNPVKSLRSE